MRIYTDSNWLCHSLYLSAKVLADGLVLFRASSTSSVVTGSMFTFSKVPCP